MSAHPIALGVAVFFGIITLGDTSGKSGSHQFMLVIGAFIAAGAAAISALPPF
jgi:hypothetical protein